MTTASFRIQIYPSARSIIHLRRRPRQREDVYRLNEVVNGSAEYGFEGSRLTVQTGDIIFLKPGWRSLIGMPSVDLLSIRFDLFDEDQRSTIEEPLPDAIVFSGLASEKEALRHALRNARDELALKRRVDRARLQIEVALTFFLSEQQYPTVVPSVSDKLSELIRELTLHPERRLTTAEMANNVKCSERHLRRLFLSTYGISPSDFAIRERIRHAKELILHEFASVKDTAYSLGYPDPYNFSLQFKKSTGVSPSQFRAHAMRKARTDKST